MVNIVVWCVLPLHKFSFEIFSLLFGFYDVHGARGSATNCGCRMNLIRFLLLFFIFYSFGWRFFFLFLRSSFVLFPFFSSFHRIHIRSFAIQDYAVNVAHTHIYAVYFSCAEALARSFWRFVGLNIERNNKRKKRFFFYPFLLLLLPHVYIFAAVLHIWIESSSL